MSDFETSTDQSAEDQPRCTPRELIELIGELLVHEDNTPEEIASHIQSLDILVREHFARETLDGIYEEIVFHTPWLTPVSECLRQQRQELQLKLTRLANDVLAGDGSPTWREGVRESFEQFVDLFFEHDAGVQNLMQAQSGWAQEPRL